MKRGLAGALLLFLAWTSLAAGPQARQHLQSATVMGFRHYEAARLWPELMEDDPLTLVREPDNSHDSQAIRVEWRGEKLGYVPRADNIDLARLMDQGSRVEGRITRLVPSRRYNSRIQFDVYLTASQ